MITRSDDFAVSILTGRWKDAQKTAIAIGQAAYIAYKLGNKNFGDKQLVRHSKAKFYVVAFAAIDNNTALIESFFNPTEISDILLAAIDIGDPKCIEHFVNQASILCHPIEKKF